MPNTDSPSPEAGIPFGRYRIQGRLGRGGMGEVFRADQMGPLGPVRPVALKRLLPQLARDPATVRLFLEEMQTAAVLNHPNIATTYDFGEVDGVYFLAMELIEGVTLRELLDRTGPLPVAAALAVTRDVALALEHAHGAEKGGVPAPVVHGDVSPHNVMVSRAGAVKLLDFGVARAEAKARGGAARGKLGYAAPEQMRGGLPDRRSDLFALGVMIYECLTTLRPFERDTAEAVLAAELRAEHRPLSELRPEAGFLDRLIERTLAPAPEARFAGAPELLAWLAQAEQALPLARASELATLVERSGALRAHRVVEMTQTGMAAMGPRAEPLAAHPIVLPVDDAAATLPADAEPLALQVPTPTPSWALTELPSQALPPPRRAWVKWIGAGLLAGAFPVAFALFWPIDEPVMVTAAVPPPAPLSTRVETSPAPTATRREPEIEPPHEPTQPPAETEAGRPPPLRRRSPPRKDPERAAPSSPTTEPAPREETAAQAYGLLSVRTQPWARLSLDGQSLGEGVKPRMPVPAGRHRLLLTPGEGAFPQKVVEVEIEAGRETIVQVVFATDKVSVDRR